MSTYFKGLLLGLSKILHVKHQCLGLKHLLNIVADIFFLSGMIWKRSALMTLLFWSDCVYVFPDLFQKGLKGDVLVSIGLSHMTYAF